MTDTAFFDSDGNFVYSRSLQTSVGVAYVSGPFELEVDLRYHASQGPYAVYSSKQPIVTSTSTGGGPPTNASAPFSDIQNQFRNTFNYAIGTKYALSESVELHAGYFRSNSPLADGDNALFRKVDLNGITFGAAAKIRSLSGSLGLAYEFGKSDPYLIPSSATGDEVSTTVSVSSISVLYALSFAF